MIKLPERFSIAGSPAHSDLDVRVAVNTLIDAIWELQAQIEAMKAGQRFHYEKFHQPKKQETCGECGNYVASYPTRGYCEEFDKPMLASTIACDNFKPKKQESEERLWANWCGEHYYKVIQRDPPKYCPVCGKEFL